MKTWVLKLSFLVLVSALVEPAANRAREQTSVATPVGIATQSMPPIKSFAIRDDADSSNRKAVSCLPKDVEADEVITYNRDKRMNVTVAKKLIEIKSRCRRGKLVDARGREVRFFRPACWGNPPADYQEIRQQEAAALANLKKRYTVIVFSCSLMTQ